MVWADGVPAAMGEWTLSRPQVLVACWFVGAYGTVDLFESRVDTELSAAAVYRSAPVASEWVRRWRGWAQESAHALWCSEYDEVPDPPRDAR